jgi:hypothetical protein
MPALPTTGGGGFAYEPSEQGASAHGGASALSMDSFTLAEQVNIVPTHSRVLVAVFNCCSCLHMMDLQIWHGSA